MTDRTARPEAPALYAYDKTTGEYKSDVILSCQWSPRENKWLIPAGATAACPPATGANEAACYDKSSGAWEIKADHRGEVWYDTETREEHKITAIGAEPENTWTQTQPADEAAKWDAETETWAAPFETQRSVKRQTIWAQGDSILAAVKANYTQAEIESWSKQEQGAKDIAAGDAETEAAQFVAAIAQGRGIETETLVEKILANVESYGALSAAVIGEQQRLDDLIKSAETTADLDAIAWTLNPLSSAEETEAD